MLSSMYMNFIDNLVKRLNKIVEEYVKNDPFLYEGKLEYFIDDGVLWFRFKVKGMSGDAIYKTPIWDLGVLHRLFSEHNIKYLEDYVHKVMNELSRLAKEEFLP